MNCNSVPEKEDITTGPLFTEMHMIKVLSKRIGIKLLTRLQLDVSMEQVPILVCLQHYSALSQQQIADHLDRDKGSIARSISSLLQHGMITVTRDAKNKRSKSISISELGLAQTQKVTNATKALTENINSCMAAKGLSKYLETLTTLKNCLHHYYENLTPPQT